MDIFDLNKRVTTRIDIRGYDIGGSLVFKNTGHNTFTYSASDILMNGALGSGPSTINRLYVRFSNNLGVSPDGSDGTLTSTTAGLITTVRSNFLDTANANCGGFWLNVLSMPYQQATTSNYVGNEATLYFRITSSSVSQAGAGFTAGASGSYVAAMGLAVPFDPNDPTKDKIFSAMNYTTFANPAPFYIPTGGQVAVDYTFALGS